MKRQCKAVRVGAVQIGGGAPVSVQSMTNTDTHDVEATYAQVRALAAAGCDVVRLAVPDTAAAATVYELKNRGITTPLVADIHFDYRIALAAVDAGADKIRINPGNIGDAEKTRAVVRACRLRGVPIRIGVNTGSLEPALLQKYGKPTAEALAESAINHAKILEALDFTDTVLSVKASSVPMMIEANRLLAERTDYPLHLGVTEAGAGADALVKSSVGIGALLADGIGDTVRVSLTDDPVREVEAARRILSVLGLSLTPHMDVVACPTCGRTKIDLIPLWHAFTERAAREGLDKKPIKVALMGCAVNGPGEAREADIGFAGGAGECLLFKKGEVFLKVPEANAVDVLIEEIKKM